MSALNMAQYQCHKQVSAGKIVKIETRQGGGGCIHYRDRFNQLSWLDVSVQFIDKHRPIVDGYLVRYDDGYMSFSPAEAFESGYSRIEDELPR